MISYTIDHRRPPLASRSITVSTAPSTASRNKGCTMSNTIQRPQPLINTSIGENMPVTMKTIPVIINDLKKSKPPTLYKDSDKPLSSKEAVMQLAPILLAKKEEGFTTVALVDALVQHDIIVKPHNLTRYLRGYSSAQEVQYSRVQEKMAATPPSTIEELSH